MIRKIKTVILTLALALIPVAPLAVSTSVSADTSDSTIQSGVCGGADTLKLDSTNGNAKTCSSISDGTKGLNGIITTAVNVLTIIVGIVAVIMIIVGGFRYVASGGKQESVTSAKNTILYAVIGLVIVALAQVVVRFVLQKTTTNT